MSELLWDDVAYLFDPDLMGSLPDVRVPDTSMEDWQAVLDLIGESGWKCQYSEGDAVLPAGPERKISPHQGRLRPSLARGWTGLVVRLPT
ncbi:hypothetical protein ABT255_58350 [Streptomyces mirabilis]|uniref:hypothetical protein n=1 Tax=Streptomyces mirabilis TaxID=68239 RepID=UPI0033271942